MNSEKLYTALSAAVGSEDWIDLERYEDDITCMDSNYLERIIDNVLYTTSEGCRAVISLLREQVPARLSEYLDTLSDEKKEQVAFIDTEHMELIIQYALPKEPEHFYHKIACYTGIYSIFGGCEWLHFPKILSLDPSFRHHLPCVFIHAVQNNELVSAKWAYEKMIELQLEPEELQRAVEEATCRAACSGSVDVCKWCIGINRNWSATGTQIKMLENAAALGV